MCPSFTTSDTANLRSPNPKASANVLRRARGYKTLYSTSRWLLWCAIEPANFLNLFFRQFRLPISFSKSRPFLARHILAVIARGAKEKMVRIDTSRVVAPMADAHSFRYRTPNNFPLEAAGNVDESVSLSAANSKGTVTISLAGFPFPTAVSSVILRMKSSDIFGRKHGFKYTHVRGAEQ